MSSFASGVGRVKTRAPTSLSSKMMDYHTSSTRLLAASVSVKRLLTAARLRPSPLSKSDLSPARRHNFFCQSSRRMLLDSSNTGTKSPAKGIRGEIISRAAPYLSLRMHHLFAFGVIEGDNPPIPYFPKRSPPTRQEPTQESARTGWLADSRSLSAAARLSALWG